MGEAVKRYPTTGGDGRVEVLIFTVDNGTGDSLFAWNSCCGCASSSVASCRHDRSLLCSGAFHTIDYSAHTLELTEPRSFHPPPGAVAVPIIFSDRLAVVPLTIEVADRAPLRARVIVDTGPSEALVLRYPFAEKHRLLAIAEKPASHLNLEGRTLTFSKMSVERLAFAGSSFNNVSVRIYATPAGAGGYTATDGALGNEILRHSRHGRLFAEAASFAIRGARSLRATE